LFCSGGAKICLAGCLCAQGKLEEARPPMLSGLNILESTLGGENEHTLAALCNCIKMLEQLGDQEELVKLKARFKSPRANLYFDMKGLDKEVILRFYFVFLFYFSFIFICSLAFFLMPTLSKYYQHTNL
jgi:hypothetical protein